MKSIMKKAGEFLNDSASTPVNNVFIAGSFNMTPERVRAEISEFRDVAMHVEVACGLGTY